MKDQFHEPQDRRADPDVGARKPRILVAGEFSSGKTQLINGLIGTQLLPSNVVATALPPVWLVAGTPGLCALDLLGKPLPHTDISQVDVTGTLFCIASHYAPVLRRMDIIDTPGNSDPNIPSESWERMLDYADIVVWCTTATQAWRQSEKAVWQNMPERLRGTAILLVTHADLLVDTRSADRLMRRIARETQGFFARTMLVSLLDDRDLATIRSELATACDQLETLGGADCPDVSAFAAQHAFGEFPADPPPQHNLALQHNAASRSIAAQEAPAPELAPSATSVATLPSGRARSLWGAISSGRDLSSPRVILAAVEALIAAIDLPEGQSEPPTVTINQSSVVTGKSADA